MSSAENKQMKRWQVWTSFLKVIPMGFAEWSQALAENGRPRVL